MSRHPSHGFDYGLKPTILLVPNPELSQLVIEELVAVGYGTLPEYGLLVRPPFVGLCFRSSDAAERFFDILNSWCQPTGESDRINISFVEFGAAEYGICFYPNPQVDGPRSFDEFDPREFELHTLHFGLKVLPRQSGGYDWFKNSVSGKYFLLVAVTPEGTPIPYLAIRKRDVVFYLEDDVPVGSPEASLIQTRDHLTQAISEGPATRIPNPLPEEIARTRQSRLRRFFPVSLARLAYYPDFIIAKSILGSKGFRDWQVNQAACNLILRSRQPSIFSGEDYAVDVLKYLLDNYEKVSLPLPTHLLTERAIRKQIMADVQYLLSSFSRGESKPVQVRTSRALMRKLDEHGLLS